ncbi:Mu transposase domain-containing protein, partial [Nocardia thailandica]
VEVFDIDYRSMVALPPVTPPIGLHQRVRLARDYYVRVDTCDYSVDPRVIGRFVDVTASPRQVTAHCDGQLVASHARSWAKQDVITDPAHAATAASLRAGFAEDRRRREQARRHPDGHPVALRALPDYDALFGVDFTVPTTESRHG